MIDGKGYHVPVVLLTGKGLTMGYPFKKTWWIAGDSLLGGCYPGTPDMGGQRQMLASLLDMGISCFVNLQEENETGAGGNTFRDYRPVVAELARQHNMDVVVKRFPIRDQSTPDVATMSSILDYIDEQLEAGRKIYVHCWGGNGRTGTVAGCWLIRHDITPDDVFKVMKEGRNGREFTREAPENSEQRTFVREWIRNDQKRSETESG